MAPSVGAADQIVVPNNLASIPGNSQFGSPLACVPPLSERYQQVYRGFEVGSGTITAIAFRREEALIFPDGSPITIPNVTITLSSTSAGPDTLSPTFASNTGADAVTVFSGDVTSFTSVTGPGLKPFDTIIPLMAAFTFDATTGRNLLMDITVPSCPANALISFDVASVANDSVSMVRVSDASSSTGLAATSGLVTQFTLTPLSGAASEELVVTNLNDNSVRTYPRSAGGNTPPLRGITGPATGLNNPVGVALDLTNNELVVVNKNSHSVTVYSRAASGDTAPLRTLRGALFSPQGLALDLTNNELVVLNPFSPAILVYSRTASGNTAPLRTLSGAATGLAGPAGVALDLTNNELVVANSGTNSITVYSRTASGNTAPLRTLIGGATGLSVPVGLVLDLTSNELVVANSHTNSVTVYSRTASGDTAPLRTLSGGATGLNGPFAVAVTASSPKAVLQTPAPGTVLPGSTVTFTWSAGSGVAEYWLDVGTTPGGSDLLHESQGTNLSGTVSGLPTTGQPVYVRLWSLIAGVWQFNDYTYTAFGATCTPAAKADQQTPAPGSVLAGATVTFTWSQGCQVAEYWLDVGTTPGGSDLLHESQGTNLSGTVSGLPTTGQPVYARLWSRFTGVWQQFNDYTFTACSSGCGDGGVGSANKAGLQTIVPGTTWATATFTWSAGSGVVEYWLDVGTTPAGSDLLHQSQGTNLSATVSGLPATGQTVYVRLWSRFNGLWQEFNDYTYVAAGASWDY